MPQGQRKPRPGKQPLPGQAGLQRNGARERCICQAYCNTGRPRATETPGGGVTGGEARERLCRARSWTYTPVKIVYTNIQQIGIGIQDAGMIVSAGDISRQRMRDSPAELSGTARKPEEDLDVTPDRV